MYFNVEIEQHLTDIVRFKNSADGANKCYTIIDDYLDEWKNVINGALQNLYETVENAPRAQIVLEKKTSRSDLVNSAFYYCFDFHIEMENSREIKQSLPLRIAAEAKAGASAILGVRTPLLDPTKKAKRGDWQGETIQKNGQVPIWTNYSIGTVVTMPTQERFVENAGSAIQRVWGVFNIILTDRAFLLFVKKSKGARNVISFISMEDVIEQDAFKWFTNGWREDFPDFNEKSKWDNCIIQTTIAKPSPTGKTLLLDYFVQNSATKDIRWFMPNIYVTAEHRLSNHSQYLIKHNNLSIGETEDNNVFLCLLNTTPVGIKYLFAVKGE